jgi:hypothetical protein
MKVRSFGWYTSITKYFVSYNCSASKTSTSNSEINEITAGVNFNSNKGKEMCTKFDGRSLEIQYLGRRGRDLK